MSNTLSGQNLGVFPYNLDGLQNIDVNSINGQQLDFSNLVQYRGNTDDLDMGPYNIQTAHPAAANNDVVNLLSLISRMSALTGYILGINGLNYVPYSGGTANTNLGVYGLSAGNITSLSSLNVGGVATITNLIKTEFNNVLSGYSPSTITIGNDFGTITNSAGVYQSTSTAVFASLVLGTLTPNQAYIVSLSLKSVDTGNNTNLYLYGSTTPNMTGQTGQIVAFSIPPNTTTFTTFTNNITFPSGSTYLLLVYFSQKPSGIDTLYWNQFSITGLGSSIKNLITPTTSLDAANKLYVDNTISSTSSLLVPYTGASSLLNLGANSLTASTAKFTAITAATPTLALGVDALGNLNSFAVPSATNILPLNNVFTGTNQFNNSVLLNTATPQGSLTVYNTTDSLPGGGSGSALAVYSATNTDSALLFGCASNTTFAIRSSGSLVNPVLALYSPVIPGMLTFTQNEATMTHGGNSFSLGNTRFLTSTINSGVSSASVLAVSPTTITSSAGTYTALANSTTIEFKMRILAEWIGGVSYTLTMVNTNWSNIKAPILITVQSPIGTTIGSATPTFGGTSQITYTYPQGANGNIYIYIYYGPLGPTPSFSWTNLSVVANVLRSNLYSTKTAMAVNTTVPSFAGLALQSITASNGAGNETTIENFIVGDVSAGTKYPKGYSIGFNAGNLAANILCQQASAGAGTTFYDINSQAAYHSWKSRPNTANSVDMVLNYNAGNGGLRLNKNGASRTTSNLLDVAGTISCDGMAIASASTTHIAGDNSYMRYGPNGTWNAYLTVGATPDKSGASNAQVITTNGNLHLDGGNSSDIYYGYYPNSRGTPNSHRWYGTNYVFDTIPENSAGYARVMCLDGGTLRRGQCMQKRLYQNGAVAWGGGINLVSAFYKWNQTSVVRISGKYSGYWTSGYMAYVYVRIHSQTNGADYGLYLPTYTNNAYNHITIPFDIVYDGSELPTTGWFDLYIANSSGLVTDGNDQITINVSVLPANSF